MTEIAITGVGLATSRGGMHDLGRDAGGAALPVAMPWQPARRYRPLVGLAPAGRERLVGALHAALAECGGSGPIDPTGEDPRPAGRAVGVPTPHDRASPIDPTGEDPRRAGRAVGVPTPHDRASPIVAASCNGGAASFRAEDWRTSFELGYGPIASAACASGMHALYLARQLIAAGAPEVRVVAGDIVTPPCHTNFEALRVLSDEPAPFQPDASGFLLGEAAVALRLVPATSAPDAPRLVGPVLGHDLDGDDGIARVLATLGAGGPVTPVEWLGPVAPLRSVMSLAPELVIGQGAGPAESDRAELAAIAAHVAPEVPLATALAGFGHTLGASSLLSVALAVLTRDSAIAALRPPHPTALDGRPLDVRRSQRTVVVCRALGGACGACFVGGALSSPRQLAWAPRSKIPPLRDPVLRQIAAAAEHHRPAAPPDLLIVTMDAPLPPSALIGQRILPTSVLEMTPGQVPQLIARAWGYPGPALCLVGGDPAPLVAACRATHDRVFRVAIRGMDGRDVEWDA